MKIVIEIKPCPFCGKDQGEPRNIGGEHWVICCGYCGAQGPDDMTQQDAAKLWNMSARKAGARNKKKRLES